MAEPEKPKKDDAAAGNLVEPHLQVQHSLPRTLSHLGVWVGLILVVFGFALMVLRLGYASAAVLCVCVGFGIILVAFGSQAGGKWTGFWATGAGALAVALYFILQGMPIQETQTYARGAIEDSSSYGVVRIFGSQDLLVGKAGSEDYKFAAFANDLTSADAYVFATKPAAEGEAYPPEFYIGCIPVSLFKDRFGKSEDMSLSLQWRPADKRFELVDLKDQKTYGEWSKKRCAKPPGPSSPSIADQVSKFFGGLLGTPASAQEMSGTDLNTWIFKLEATDPIVRDDARDALSAATDPAQIRVVTGAWDVGTSSYRADLGRLVSWTDAAALEPGVSSTIIQSLTPDQLGYAVSLAGYPDSTMQGWAKNFTTEMLNSSDPAQQGVVLDKALELLKGGNNITWPVAGKEGVAIDYVANTLTAFDAAKCSLTPENRITLSTAISALPTDPQYDALVANAQDFGTCS